ncbi:FmdB family zinc ribbon protein [Mitsuaria sp. GD03876]|uniref:FmdB family zinc ribbon protein n=1 Tax=Mitsuaria sp. GD03876 TaxID=2975399 RepID=UPI0024483EED|nr:FmdB family zinc ribbon protein [Mitsuaria sp. GD03876]MDH0865320.1 zinc ribbon domain-containing protein [Mitsuaria sp. GD03876]
MPIYAYRCGDCGHAKDVLQKLSDAPLTVCPACGAQSFSKQVTAAGFQLKGSGWYVTDFRGGSGGGAAAPASAPASGGDAPAASGGTTSTSTSTSDSSSASGASASSSTPCGGSCACH